MAGGKSHDVAWSGQPFMCPVCGKKILNAEMGAVKALCQHVIFVLLDGSGFCGEPLDIRADDVREKVDAYIERTGEERGFESDPEEFHDHLKSTDEVYWFIDHGLACGPVFFMVGVGIRR